MPLISPLMPVPLLLANCCVCIICSECFHCRKFLDKRPLSTFFTDIHRTLLTIQPTHRLRFVRNTDLFSVVSDVDLAQEGILHCALAAMQCIVIAPVCVFVCVSVCGSVTTITRNCVHRSSPNWVCR